ncbi:MAG TPA: manganese-dependent inorganic pyrophosphatase [Candidatus Altiarchaeales archaeon]|nr:manganese-dependent inorganic pyrophosphatase [Candidatus Altiarchaeales archaeon]
MDEKIFVIGHKNPDTDSICSAIAYAEFKNRTIKSDVVPARCGDLNSESKFVLDKFNIDTPKLIEDATDKSIILVDHNEFSQAVDNLDKANIKEVIDHHKVNFKYSEPIYFLSKPVGATATIISKKFFENKIEPRKEIAGILLASILSDTVIFKSVTTTSFDRKMAERLAEICEISNIKDFGIEVKRAKSSLKGLKPQDIILSDFKDFNMGGKKIGIGQIEIVDRTEVDEIRNDLISELDNMRERGNYTLVILMVTDIIKEGSELLVTGDYSIVEKTFRKSITNNSVYLESVMSRKKEIVHPLESTLS